MGTFHGRRDTHTSLFVVAVAANTMMFKKIIYRLRSIFRPGQFERDMDEELRFHLEREQEENARRGMDAETAESAARRNFGNLTLTKENMRLARAGTFIESIHQDLRLSARKLKRDAAFTVLIVVTVAVAAGVNTAVFSVVNGVVLQPLAYPRPEQIVMVWQNDVRKNEPEGRTSFANFADWRERSQTFEVMAAVGGSGFDRHPVNSESEVIRGKRVTADFFKVFGVSPARGRTFEAADEEPGRGDVAVISDGLWRRAFGADESVIGKTVVLNNENLTVVGVMPVGFSFPEKIEYWRPLTVSAVMKTKYRINVFLTVVGRIKPNVSLEQASREMETIAANLRDEYPRENEAVGIRIVPLHEQTVGDVRLPLFVLCGAVGSLLLISCVNIANLLLGKSITKRKEIAVRLALGASRRRVVRLLFFEGLLLSLLGSASGVILAHWVLKLLIQSQPSFLPRVADVSIDWRVLAFSAVLSATTALIFCLVPALYSLKVDVNESLKTNARGVVGAQSDWLRRGLVAAQISLTFMLLIAAGLLIKSFWRLQQVDLGFDSDNLLIVRVRAPEAKYKWGPPLENFYVTLEERLRSLPGVAGVGSSTSVLLGELEKTPILVEGDSTRISEGTDVPINQASPEFFSAMSTPVLRGRSFTRQDVKDEPSVAIISDAAAKRFWPGREAIGNKFKFNDPGFPNETWFTVIGVVANTRRRGVERPGDIECYLPGHSHMMDIAIRTNGRDPSALADAVRHEVNLLDADARITGVQTMNDQLSQMNELKRYTTLVTGVLAAASLFLALTGLYGVVAYLVAQKTKEISVRVALGARSADIIRMVMLKSLRLIFVGLIAGLFGALALTKLIQNLLYDTTPTDPLTYFAVAIGFIATAGTATFVAARKAKSINPLNALKEE